MTASYAIEEAIPASVEVVIPKEEFDFGDIKSLEWRQELINDTDDLRAQAEKTLEIWIEMGAIAEKWKNRLDYGLYGKWERDKFPGSNALAWTCRSVYKKFCNVDSNLVRKFDAPAAKALAAASVKEEALERAIALASEGRQVTEKLAKACIKGDVVIVDVGKTLFIKNKDSEYFRRKGEVVKVDPKNRLVYMRDVETGEPMTLLDVEISPPSEHIPPKRDLSATHPPAYIESADLERLNAMEVLVRDAIAMFGGLLQTMPRTIEKTAIEEWVDKARGYF